MNPYDPTQPQPGDWEAALSVIEAAEARADAVRRWRRWGGWGAAAALATAVLWYGVRSDDASSSSSSSTAAMERAAEVEVLASIESDQNAVEDYHAPAPEAGLRDEEAQAPAAGQTELAHVPRQPGREEPSIASSSDADITAGEEPALQRSPTAEAFVPPSRQINAPRRNFEAGAHPPKPEVAEAVGAADEGERLYTELAAAESDLKALIPISPAQGWQGVVGPVFQAMPAIEVVPTVHAWGALVSWEGGEWAAAVTREVQEGWFVRLGGVWDGRHRKWVATPAYDVFGALQAPRSVLSDQAIWASAGLEYRRHIKGRLGAVARMDAQYLVARHLVEGQWAGGEQIVAGNAAAWGQLEEESPWRLGWGAGCDWSVSEAHAVRMTVGGFWSPTPTYEYIDWTEGMPRAAGELRLTWLWK